MKIIFKASRANADGRGYSASAYFEDESEAIAWVGVRDAHLDGAVDQCEVWEFKEYTEEKAYGLTLLQRAKNQFTPKELELLVKIVTKGI